MIGILVLLAAVFGFGAHASDLTRCQPEAAENAKLYSSDLKWHQPLPAMLALYGNIYQSGKRLPKRAYWDSVRGQYLLPYHMAGNTPIVVTEEFIGAVRTHIEKALVRKYADAVFFSDMGHSHMLIPEQKYHDEYRDIPADEHSELYSKAFADREVRFLYHTAEQMEMSGAEPHIIWRQFTRNLVGENRTGGEVNIEAGYHEPGHTLRDVVGYRWFSAGFNLSASKDGCFPFTTPAGVTMYFDLSMYDLESESGISFGSQPPPKWNREICGPPSLQF